MGKQISKPTTGMLQGEVLILMESLRQGGSDCRIVGDAKIGDDVVTLTLTKQNGRCHALIECPNKAPRLISCPLYFEDATEENNETFDIACAWRFIVDQ